MLSSNEILLIRVIYQLSSRDNVRILQWRKSTVLLFIDHSWNYLKILRGIVIKYNSLIQMHLPYVGLPIMDLSNQRKLKKWMRIQ